MPLRHRTTGLLAAGLVLSLAQLPTSPATGAPGDQVAVDPDDFRGLGDTPLGMEDLDERGVALPSAAQRTAARGLGADVRWNDFGTPSSILPRTGSLGTASGDPAAAARSWLRRNATVLGLSTGEVDDLELVNDQRMAQSPGHAVLFRQTFDGPGGDLSPALGSMVTVGVSGDRIHYVSSSLTKGADPVPAASLSPQEGWVAAADSVGIDVSVGELTASTEPREGWTTFGVPGLAEDQLARVRSLAMADGTVRPVVEANVVDVDNVQAYTVMVDAVTGDLLHREHQVEQSNESSGFQGEVTASECGPQHPFDISDDTTRTITATAAAVVTTNDLVVKILDPADQVLTAGDTGTSPEVATYTSPDGPLAQGTYAVQICPFDDPTVPFVAPGTYAGTVSLSETEGETPSLPYPPKWRYFDTNPTPIFTPEHTPTNSVVGCWVVNNDGARVPDCTEPVGQLYNLASRFPWDVDTRSGLSTLTTEGNNARDREAWGSPLTPGGFFQAPVSPTREYTDEFTDAWNNSKCDPANLVPGGNDIFASVTNLFVNHNRMHDYSYFLGFTEKNYNLQQNNFGNNGNGAAENDPEVGNVQAGALTGGAPSYLGRDNANQIALQDGVPGITNQYLFQPIAGAFYAPCTDGGLDMGIVGHEYTHAISNRMVGGPDEGLTSEQGGAMGESWSDLVAGEFQFAHGYSNGGNIWAIGLYATGNKKVAIRDYAVNDNPLTYGEYGFDTTGDEVHADGEIWNATNWRVRQALVNKYDARFPYNDKALQLRCSESRSYKAPVRAQDCPGNRRWIALMFDSFLLQQGATSMLDARDAMLAADRMRFGGANQSVMWKAFARSGMGTGASTPTADSGDVEPSFAAPSGNTTVRFKPVLADGTPVAGEVYLGTYEARATPLADTLPGTPRGASAPMTPGTYTGLLRSDETGLTRFTATIGGASQTVRITAEPNLAAKAKGASVISTSAGSLNPDSLIDSTESTNWAGVNEGGENVDEKNPFVTVDLAGGLQTVRRLGVSAMLRPADDSGGDVPLAQDVDEDPDSGSRFTALRRFAIEVCTTDCAGSGASWRRVFTSSPDAFPGDRPRPTAPNLIFRSFKIDAVQARAVRLVALENQCTGFAGYAGEQDNDPLNDTDCKTASDRGQSVRAAELEVFTR
ncbi:peptidase M36 [Nocardioides sp. HDW12B]|uniref:M36 family metallopeptidase n=1 Tax=Nocardioides sp. HDW12B TaxID=2714939 RepID=UPI00140AA643|nr:M36 family metallopeptidase [Nocardioides sp. HDW12B]QIK67070.1 peptidase M36 [Nocardioides sp. HDW12B]